MIINNYDIKLDSIVVNWVGNKTNDDGVLLSKSIINISEDTSNILLKYFVSSFKFNELYNFSHNSALHLNEVYSYASDIFDTPNALLKTSHHLANFLYENSLHPSIKSGEFYVVHFTDIEINGASVDAIGLFKSEKRDTFINIDYKDSEFNIQSGEGINVAKLDKGCLVFNTDKENGYVVAVVDNTNKGAEAHYWIDDFLHVRQRKDEYYNTQNVMSLAKNFVVKELPKAFGVSKADQAELLNKATQFFKEKDTFDMDEFANEVIAQPEVIDSFNQYKESYAKERDIKFADSFSISDTVVKKQVRAFKSVIKLDKNFHIYIHGDRQLIEQGEDNKGKFYKVYYKEEQ